MSNYDRFSIGVTPTMPEEVGTCGACSGVMYDYELRQCPACGDQVHRGCLHKCDHCAKIGCKSCLEPDTEGNFYCDPSCMWEEYKERQQVEKAAYREAAAQVFDQARQLAHDVGLDLRKHTDSHYSLRGRQHGSSWVLNLYPGNQRLYSDPKHRGPFLKVPKPWTFSDVIRAAAQKLS